MRPQGTIRAELVTVSRLDLKKVFNVSTTLLYSEELNTSRVCFLTALTGVLMLLSVLLASYRRRSKSRVLKAVLWASYTMTGYLIAFTMGQMLHSNSSSSFADNVLWALYLLIAFGSADSFSTYSLVDSEQWRRYNWQFVLKLVGLVIILITYYELFTAPFEATMILLLILAVITKVSTKNLSIEASATPVLHKNCKSIADYMSTEHEAGDEAEADPLSMKGYRYLVQGEAVKEHGVTLEEVWSCQWGLLSPGPTGDRLKDTCVSFSLYRLLRIKYAGYKLPREAHRKTFRLVRHGLMESEENGYERAFRVVEDELALLFDSFYTKRVIIFEPRGHRLCLRFAEFLLLVLVSFLFIASLFVIIIQKYDLGWMDQLYSITSLIAMMAYFFSECLQFFALVFTTWMKVACICKYTKGGDSWLKRPFRRKCMERICKLPSFKPWERKLHPYSLVESYGYSPCRLFTERFVYMFIDSPRDGKKESHPIDLPVEVRKAVFECLKNSVDSSRNDGIAYLRKPNVSKVLMPWEFNLELETQAEVIMVWHVATTMYEVRVSGRPRNSLESRTNFLVATSLSKYLAYLVVFAPRLLPDHPYLTESLFDQTVSDARDLLKGCKTVPEKVDKLRASAQESGKNNTTLVKGARLEKQLSDAMVEPDVIWETLAKFWVEMTLYIAPSKDDRAHAEILAAGGEFVTHLWALLYHAGVKRCKGSMQSHGHTSSTSEVAGPSMMPQARETAVLPVPTEIENAVGISIAADKPDLG